MTIVFLYTDSATVILKTCEKARENLADRQLSASHVRLGHPDQTGDR
jgi:hypothetical protein